MKEKYGKIVLGAALIIAAILMFACSNGATVKTLPPCCEIIPCEDVPPNTLIEIPVLTRDYEEEVPNTQCVTCLGIIPNEIYGEHIKTCCP